MLISPVSYSSYQNTLTMQNNANNKPQIPENQMSFRGAEKLVTSKTTANVIKNNSGKILATLSALGVAAMTHLGIKTSKERAVEKDFEEMTTCGGRRYSVKDQTPELYKPLLKAYSENPQLVTELYNASITIDYNNYSSRLRSYSNEDILFIHEINKVNPSLTPLAKKALGGLVTRFDSSCRNSEAVREKVRNKILNNPQKVEQAIKKIEETKEIHNSYSYEIYEDYYTLEDLLKTLNEL